MASKTDSQYEDLLEILKREERASVGYESDQIYDDQIQAFKRYIGENYGDEKAGRSSVHDRTIFETVEWLRPDLRRVFTAGGSACQIEPWAPGTADVAQEASDYLNQLFLEEMEGESIIDAFAFDGLLQKRGTFAVYWRDAELGEPGLTQGDQMVAQHLVNQGAEIIGIEPIDEQVATIHYQMVKRKAGPEIVMIAPEDFRMSARAISLDKPRYCGHIERHMKSELKALMPEHADLIEEFGNAEDESAEIDERRQQRFWDEDEMYANEPNAHEDTQEIRLWREYVHFDKDGDGYAERVEGLRLDGIILSCEPVDDNPYFSWTPIPIPHRWFGLSVHDIAHDIQKIKTTLLRGALDSVYLSIAPMKVVNQNINLSDLLAVRPGGLVRSRGSTPVNNNVMPLVTPDLSPSAIQMMEVIDQSSERRTGVNRNAQGMDPDALNKTATGIKLMQNAASLRKEEIAANLGKGLEQMFRKIYRLVVKMSEGPQSIHMGKGKSAEFDPSQWPEEAKIKVHVGNGSGDRESQLGQLMNVLGMQREWMQNFGPGNPIVTIKHMHNTVEDMMRVMGMRNADRHFKDPEILEQENPQALQQLMQPPPNPELEMEKRKMAMEQQKEQAKMQLEQQKAQFDQQLEQQKLEAEMALKEKELEAEMALKSAQVDAELRLKEAQLAAEIELKREMKKLEIKHGLNGSAGGGSSEVNIGGRPG